MIDLVNLIQIAPFPDDVRADLAGKIPNFSDDQKRDLENLAWDLIIESYENKVAFATETAMTQMALGQKKAAEVDLDKIEDDIFNELLTRMVGVNTQEQIQEVREKLQGQSLSNPQPNLPKSN